MQNLPIKYAYRSNVYVGRVQHKREQEKLNYQGLNTGNEYRHNKDLSLSIFLVLIMSKVFGILVSDKQIKICLIEKIYNPM